MTPAAPESMPTRVSLLCRIRNSGEDREKVWRDFYQLYAPIISGFARRMGAETEDVSDILQDVMIGFFAVSPSFVYDPSKGRFRGYLKACTWRTLQGCVRKKMRAGGTSLEHVDASEVAIDEAWNDIWETERLQRALANVRSRYLSRPDRMKTFRAFEMYVLLERDADDVSQELQMTVESIHQAKTRVSKALKQELDALEDLA